MKTFYTSTHPWAAAAIALILLSAQAHADELRFALAGDQEVPPVKTQASGTATIRVDPGMGVSGQVTTAGIAGTMAHIHLGAPGVNGRVVIDLDRSGDNSWKVPDGAKLTENQYQAYRNGELYINVHSMLYKAGELRGQLKP